jgi:hypothetical protein
MLVIVFGATFARRASDCIVHFRSARRVRIASPHGPGIAGSVAAEAKSASLK